MCQHGSKNLRSNYIRNIINNSAFKIFLFFLIAYIGTNALSHFEAKTFDAATDAPGSFKLVAFIDGKAKVAELREIVLYSKDGATFGITGKEGVIDSPDYDVAEYVASTTKNGATDVVLRLHTDDATQWFNYSIEADDKIIPKKYRLFHVAYMFNALLFSFIVVFIIPKIMNFKYRSAGGG